MHKLLKSFTLFLIAVFTLSITSFAQRDKIEGMWYNAEKTAKINIYKATDGKFWGTIAWLKEPVRDGKERTDENNPKASARSKPLMGLPVLRHFVKDGEDTYTDGEIYDPKNGKTYSCKIKHKGNQLDVRGYVGISMIGRTTVWEKAD